MRTVITGGSGFLGRRIYEKLLERGHTVYPMAMEGEDTTGLDNVLTGDITRPDSFEFPECDAVIHCAGILESSHPPKELMMKVNYNGTRVVFEKALAAGAERFVFISTISALGPHGSRSEPMTEEMEPGPIDAYGRSKLKAERYLEKAPAVKDTRVTVLRPSVLYGPGMNLNSSGMKTFTSIRKGIMPMVGDGSTTLNMLFVENLVHAVMLSLEGGRGYRVYHVSERPYTQKEVIGAIERRMGKKGHRRYPGWLLWTMTLLSETFSPLMRGPPPLSWNKYHGLTSDIWTMSSDRIREELGFVEPFDLEEGVDRTCSHYGW